NGDHERDRRGDERSVDRDERPEMTPDGVPVRAGDEAPAEGLEREAAAPCHRQGDGSEQDQNAPGRAGGDQLECPISAGAALPGTGGAACVESRGGRRVHFTFWEM